MMSQSPEQSEFPSISGAVVVLGDVTNPTYIFDGQPVTLPSRSELLAYAAGVERAYRRWADQPQEPQPPLYDLALPLDAGPNAYIDTRGRLLPMRVSEFRPQPGGALPGEAEGEPQELIAAVLAERRTILVGEPGSGKSSALERLAWLLAAATVEAAEDGVSRQQAAPVIPLLLALKEYRGEADLIPLVEAAFNREAAFVVNSTSARLLLRAQDVRFLLLLDGLNELGRFAEDGRVAIRRTLANYPQMAVHASVRTADFDANREANAQTAWLPGATHWLVQPLVDNIGYWGDPEGESDVRDYLRRCLGEVQGKRLWDLIYADKRLRTLALNPLLLFMLKEVGGAQGGDLPADRGALVRGFVRSTRTLGAIVDDRERRKAERVLEELGRHLQDVHAVECPVEELDAIAAQIAGDDGERCCRQLRQHGLLLEDRGQVHLLHQLVQEYAAASHLVRQADALSQFMALAGDEWWRETLILALWLHPRLKEPDFLQQLMRTPSVDLRVRVAAATVLGRPGPDGWTLDPRFAVHWRQVGRSAAAHAEGRATVRFVEPHMVPVPGGQALMGGEDEEAEEDELPGCTVEVAAFEMAAWPVTSAEFRLFVEGGGYDDPSLWTPDGQAWLRGELALDEETEQQYRQLHRTLREDTEGLIAGLRAGQSFSDEQAALYRQLAALEEDEFVRIYAQALVGDRRRQPFWWGDSRVNQPTQPVVGVNWYEAMAYAAWLSRLTGEAYQLPSEAQWEWGARRGERRYPWGPDWDAAACNWSGSRLGAPSPVGLFPQGGTPDGVEEMAGNVYEWTTSLYRPYPYSANDGREDVMGGGLRVMRGGSWYTSADQVRCASRYGYYPWDRLNFTGFRLARILS